jgi:hypothetical protein
MSKEQWDMRSGSYLGMTLTTGGVSGDLYAYVLKEYQTSTPKTLSCCLFRLLKLYRSIFQFCVYLRLMKIKLICKVRYLRVTRVGCRFML